MARAKPSRDSDLPRAPAALRGIAALADRGREDWETPPWLFELLHGEFSFTVDAAASARNALLPRFWTIENDGLRQPWAGEKIFCNPPYGHKTGAWVSRASWATREEGCELAVLVVPANTETTWWHDSALGAAAEIRFIWRRVHFLLGGRRVPNSRPVFSSAVLIFRKGKRAGPCITGSIIAPDPRKLQDGAIVRQERLFG